MSQVSISGNVTRDPELRFTPSGVAVATFGFAENRKKKDGTDETEFFNVVCWKTLAENAATCVTKGMRLVITGKLQFTAWETPEGDKRSKVEILAWDFGPSLLWATAEVEKNERAAGSGGHQYSDDEVPFQ